MSEFKGPPYNFSIAEPGIFAELYLPKRSRLQGLLYDVLSRGFDPEVVIRYLCDGDRLERVRLFLQDYTMLRGLDRSRIERMEPVFGGYSMYEVDGVFKGRENRIIEERTQVVRMIFRPDVHRIMQAVGAGDECYRDVRNAAGEYLRVVDRLADSCDGDTLQPRVVRYLCKWRDDAALFLFGYVAFSLCEKLDELERVHPGSLEEEIWVCSLWNLEINRVRLLQAGV